MPRVVRDESIRPASYALPRGVPALQAPPIATRTRWAAAAGLAIVAAAVAGFLLGRRTDSPTGMQTPAGSAVTAGDSRWR